MCIRDRVYAGGEQVWRSEDGGRTWRNLTQLRQGSLLGARVNDLAVDPENPDRVAVAAATGVWISLDGGLSWQGWNENLPAFRAVRIVAAPARGRGSHVALAGAAGTKVVEWAPGFRLGWLPTAGVDKEELLRGAYGRILNAKLSAAAEGGGAQYAGSDDGRLWASLDSGCLLYTSGTRSFPVYSRARFGLRSVRPPRLFMRRRGRRRRCRAVVAGQSAAGALSLIHI